MNAPSHKLMPWPGAFSYQAWARREEELRQARLRVVAAAVSFANTVREAGDEGQRALLARQPTPPYFPPGLQ